jgi:hypothetical protein
MALFFKRKGIPYLWALLASTAFVLSPWYSNTLAKADLISAGCWLLPLALIVWDFWIEQPSIKRAVLVILTLYLGVLCGVQNLLWVASFWLPYALWSFWQRQRADGQFLPRAQGHLYGMGLGFLVLLLIYPLPGLVQALAGNEPMYGPPLSGPILRSFVGWTLRASPLIFGLVVATGFLVRSARAGRGWLVIGAVNVAIGFGLIPDPLSMAAGALGLPFRPLAEPDLFLGISLFAFLIYIALACQEMFQAGLNQNIRGGLIWLAVLAGIVITDASTFRSMPAHEVSVPSFYRMIASEPEDYILLEYPFGVSSLSDGRALGEAAYLARYSVWDLKRSMSGVTWYSEARNFDKIKATAFLFPDSLTDGNRDTAAQALGIAVREWRIGYIVVHPELVSQAAQAAIARLINQSQALCPSVQRDGLIIYRAQWHPYGCPTS